MALRLEGMTWRYLIALGLVAALSCMAYISLRAVIATQETSAATINYSGKRRYMSHRAALFAVMLANAKSPDERDIMRQRLTQAVDSMEEAHDSLMRGNDRLGLPGAYSSAIADIYHRGPKPLEPLAREYIARTRSFATFSDADLEKNQSELTWITTTATGPLLERLDAVVAAYQAESEGEIERLQGLEITVLLITFGVLISEALFIFSPMVRRVRQEHQRLLQAEASTRAILDNSYDAIVVIDADDRMMMCNRAAEIMAGQDLKLLIGYPFAKLGLDLVLPRDRSQLPKGVGSVKRLHDSAVIDIAFTTTTIDNKPVLIATMRESTEQLQHYARELERRNQELDQFAYVASHDLKAPLRALSNLVHWIVEDVGEKLGSEVEEHTALLLSRVRRLEALIDGLHSYATATRPHGETEEVDTGRLVHDVIDEFRQGAAREKREAFAITVGDHMPVLVGDRIRLWQVFSNLIANAIKHHDKPQGAINIVAKDAGDVVQFSVADDGPGIDPSCHERIFVIFQTLVSKDVKDGLGLGLALVQKIVRDAGGDIVVDSALGRGSTFRFTWPKRPASPMYGRAHA